MCHRPGGPSAAAIDLRSTVSTAEMHVIGLTPRFGDLGVDDASIVRSATGTSANRFGIVGLTRVWRTLHGTEALQFRNRERVMDVTIQLAKEFGFCYGVERAVEYAYQTRRKFLDAALAYYNGFLDQRRNDPDVREELSKTSARVARIVSELTTFADLAATRLPNTTTRSAGTSRHKRLRSSVATTNLPRCVMRSSRRAS